MEALGEGHASRRKAVSGMLPLRAAGRVMASVMFSMFVPIYEMEPEANPVSERLL